VSRAREVDPTDPFVVPRATALSTRAWAPAPSPVQRVEEADVAANPAAVAAGRGGDA
jgi:hypothetical protein